jgi:hypothetical protein
MPTYLLTDCLQMSDLKPGYRQSLYDLPLVPLFRYNGCHRIQFRHSDPDDLHMQHNLHSDFGYDKERLRSRPDTGYSHGNSPSIEL